MGYFMFQNLNLINGKNSAEVIELLVGDITWNLELTGIQEMI